MTRAQADPIIVDEAVQALWDGEPRTAELIDGRSIKGRVWELYRSVDTSSLRIRMTDHSGRVHHFNTQIIKALNANWVSSHE